MSAILLFELCNKMNKFSSIFPDVAVHGEQNLDFVKLNQPHSLVFTK